MECNNKEFIHPGKNCVEHRVMVTHHAWILTGSSFEVFVFFLWVITIVAIKLQWMTDIITHLSESIRDPPWGFEILMSTIINGNVIVMGALSTDVSNYPHFGSLGCPFALFIEFAYQ